ncbi:MAG: hypothetical protein E7363_04015 [Clostridiales bacterium]|nr:hypothetical protein [Clostridiales bacterium]
MKRSILLWQVAGLTFATALGTLLHFIYDISGESLIFAPFSAVNESTFEHMKILFFPMLIFALAQFAFFRKDSPCFWRIKAVGTGIAVLSIPLLFYTLTGIFGKLPAFVNIGIFFLSAGLGYLYEGLQFKKRLAPCRCCALYFSLLLVTAILFILGTFFPPHIPLFLDPVTGTYGIQ